MHIAGRFPRGCPEGKETYLEAAQRELLEEAGLTADSWTELLRCHLSNSVSDEYGIIFLARNLKHSVAAPEETEQDLRSKKFLLVKPFAW
ncbi:NUDIX domain-containing protein [Niabella sp. W65]|nr:NUDIX domain-containing protein [Niabella sp. W65]MCH7367097.1 NUDIX domain-containing protein [Niabella sp. W65]ULT42771.1 NUDIX domain-containing protein [Niabella sp. I65]